jgi:hypothetical protein
MTPRAHLSEQRIAVREPLSRRPRHPRIRPRRQRRRPPTITASRTADHLREVVGEHRYFTLREAAFPFRHYRVAVLDDEDGEFVSLRRFRQI